jgi:hypothetical protein
MMDLGIEHEFYFLDDSQNHPEGLPLAGDPDFGARTDA